MNEKQPSVLGGNISIYHDLREPLWKNAAAHCFFYTDSLLQTNALDQDVKIRGLRTSFINNFNSNHSQNTFCRRTKGILEELKVRLAQLHREDVWDEIKTDVARTTRNTASLLRKFDQFGGTFQIPEQSFITDGAIFIAGEPLKTFASHEYFEGLARLFNYQDKPIDFMRKAFFDGANLSDEVRQQIRSLKAQGWETVDILSNLYLHLQVKRNAPTVQEYEFNPELTKEENSVRKQKAIEESLFYIGFGIASAGYLASEGYFSGKAIDKYPIEVFLQGTNSQYSQGQIEAIGKIALAHSTHGLNSGELTARLAGSTRTTLLRAIIASLNVRSGVVHAGAIIECMQQVGEYLHSSLSAKEYIQKELARGEKLYGFGHRIHKTESDEPTSILGKDPRVNFYIETTQKGFPEKSDLIQRLREYAEAVRELRPSLGANTDFGASVLFTCLGLSPQYASAFFTAFRIPGICANVVNELQIKANSRRPPFPPILPY